MMDDVLGQEDIPGLGRAPEDPFNAAAKRCFILIRRAEERFKGMGLRFDFDFKAQAVHLAWDGHAECFRMLVGEEWVHVQALAKRNPMRASKILFFLGRLEEQALKAKEQNIVALRSAANAADGWLGEEYE